jgi:hypothetical protein
MQQPNRPSHSIYSSTLDSLSTAIRLNSAIGVLEKHKETFGNFLNNAHQHASPEFIEAIIHCRLLLRSQLARLDKPPHQSSTPTQNKD